MSQPKNRHITHAINEQRTMIMFALILEAFYEQRTSHNVRTLLGALANWKGGYFETCKSLLEVQHTS